MQSEQAQIEETRDWIERAVLTCMLKTWDLCAQAKTELTTQHFRSPKNQVVFERILDCYEEHETGMAGKTLELQMLIEKLQSKSQHNQSADEDIAFVGNAAGIMMLVNNTVQPEELVRYISKLQSYVFNSEFDDGIRRIQEARLEGIKAEELVVNLVKIGDLQSQLGDDPVHRVGFTPDDKSEVLGIPTIFEGANKILETRGFALGQTSVIRAFTGGYKTTLMLQCFEFASRAHGAIFISVADMNLNRIEQKIMKQITGHKYPPLSLGFEACEQWRETKFQLRKRQMFIVDAIQSSTEKYQYIENLLPRIERQRQESGLQIAFIDYFQRLNTFEKIINPVEKQKHIARKVESYAEKSGMAIVIGSQVTIKDGTVMTKGGRDIEENSSLTLSMKMIEKEGTKEPTRDAKIECVKARFGPGGWYMDCGYNDQFQILVPRPG